MNINKASRQHKKLIEELLELATILTQQMNKPRKNFTKAIIEELGDVKWRISQVEQYYDLDAIQKRINKKSKR